VLDPQDKLALSLSAERPRRPIGMTVR